MDRHISTPRYGAICVLTDTSRNDVALDLAEPQFDLIQPGRVGRDEVQVNFGMHRQEVRDWPALVGRLVVGDHMHLFAARPIDHNVCKESHKFGGGIPRRRFAEHFAGSWC